MIYKMRYLWGDGTWHYGGFYKTKRTEKTITFKSLDEPWFSNPFWDYVNNTRSKTSLNEKREYRMSIEHKEYNVFDENEKGEITMYFKKSGTPYVFTPHLEKGMFEMKEMNRWLIQ